MRAMLLSAGFVVACGSSEMDPTTVSVTISPSDPGTDAVLTASAVFDPDGPVTYAWTVNGSAAGDATDTLDGAVHFDKGDVVAVAATSGSVTAESMPVVVRNTAPTAPTLHIDAPDHHLQGDLLCVLDTESADADGDPVTYTFTWTVDGAPFTDTTTTTESGDTVPSELTDAGDEWTCAVTASDGEISLPPVSTFVTLAECACDLTDATDAMETLDPWDALPAYEDCLACDPTDAEALFGAGLTALMLLPESTPMQDLAGLCGQSQTLSEDVFGDGFLGELDSVGQGTHDLQVELASPYSWNPYTFDPDNAVVVSWILGDGRLQILVQDRWFDGRRLEILLDPDDVYGDGSTVLADGVVVDITQLDVDARVVFLVPCGEPGSTCDGFYESTPSGTVTFDQFSKPLGSAVRLSVDASLGATCQYSPCELHFDVVGTVDDVISEVLAWPEVPFEEERPGTDCAGSTTCMYLSLFDGLCDPTQFVEVNDALAAASGELSDIADRFALAGTDSDFSYALPSDRLAWSSDDLAFNATDANVMAAWLEALAAATSLLAQYNIVDPTAAPSDLRAVPSYYVEQCSTTCECVAVTDITMDPALFGPVLDTYLLTHAPSADFTETEDALVSMLERMLDALELRPTGRGFTSFAGYGGVLDFNRALSSEVEAALLSSSGTDEPWATAPLYTYRLGTFFDSPPMRDSLLTELGVDSLVVEELDCLGTNVSGVGLSEELQAWIRSGGGLVDIPASSGDWCASDADCTGGEVCDAYSCRVPGPGFLSEEMLNGLTTADGVPAFVDLDQFRSITCPTVGCEDW